MEIKSQGTTSRAATNHAGRLDFDEHLGQAVGGLRKALLQLLGSVGADPSTPQETSRRIGINRNMSWKISRLLNEQDQRAAVRHVPGAQGMRILCERFREAGAPAELAQSVLDAMQAFLDMVKVQVGDRTALEGTLRSLSGEGAGREGVLAARKLAFQGNSSLWGVRARVKMGLQIVSPGTRDGYIDTIMVGGLLDFWRLRSDARWPLIHYRGFADDTLASDRVFEQIDDSVADKDGPPWLRDFCSSPLPKCRRLPNMPGALYELTEGPVGNTAAMSCVFGRVLRNAAPFRADGADDRGEYQLLLNTPVELAHFDLLIHESLPLSEMPRIQLDSRMQVTEKTPIGEPLYGLEIQEQVHELGAGLSNLASPDLPRYPELVEYVLGRVGKPLSEFRGYRVSLRFPPIPTVLKISHPLPNL